VAQFEISSLRISRGGFSATWRYENFKIITNIRFLDRHVIRKRIPRDDILENYFQIEPLPSQHKELSRFINWKN
jgi:hypothetical protein